MDNEDDARYTTLLGGAVGGLRAADVAEIVTNLLEGRDRPVRLVVHPEAVPGSTRYAVEWRYLRFDRETLEWAPV